MPGLLRGVARTAVIAGTATHVSNNVSRRQAAKYQQQDQAAATQYAQQAPAMAEDTASDDMFVQLEKLGQLKDQGILTQAEFDAKKAQILGL
jgi:hypothetical protein